MVHKCGLGHAVVFAGPVFGAERFAAYRDADVFTLTPGFFEETSLAALEACAVGTPCVITRQCEIPGLEAASGGLMVDYKKEAIAGALIQVLAGGGRAVWGVRACELIKNRFTTEVVAASHVDLFTSMLAPTNV
jgi:glycosyltransferase involved in cell wall biosynthesis